MKLIDLEGMSYSRRDYNTIILSYHKDSKMPRSLLSVEILDTPLVYTAALRSIVSVAVAVSPTTSQRQALRWLLNAYADQELIFEFTAANFYPNHGEPFWRFDFIGHHREPLSALVFANLCFV